jgi:hypothetical protein
VAVHRYLLYFRDLHFSGSVYLTNVEPRAFERLTSAVQRWSEGSAVVHCRSKNRLDKSNPRIVPPWMFAIVRPGCRQTVVSYIREHCASGALLYTNPQVYPTPVHVALGGSVRKAWERVSGRQQAGFMQDAVYEFRSTPLPGTSANKEATAPSVPGNSSRFRPATLIEVLDFGCAHASCRHSARSVQPV